MKRDITIKFRVNAEEQEQILKLAEGADLSTYLRTRALAQPVATPVPVIATSVAQVKQQLAVVKPAKAPVVVTPYVRVHHPRCSCAVCSK